VIHVTASVSRLAGGLFESVRHLARETSHLNEYQISVMGLKDRCTEMDLSRWNPIPVQTSPIVGPKRFGYSPTMVKQIRLRNPCLIHLHGLWQYPSIAVLNWARRTGNPYIVSPHGMLEPWALQQSRFRKKLARFFFQEACLRKAACLRATSSLEARSIRLAGIEHPIALIPNGVVLPSISDDPQVINHRSKRRRVLFLSRIHPKKGLLNLARAWHAIRPAGWELLIVGPDEGGHLAEVRAAARAFGLEGQICFRDEVMGAAKIQCYQEADLFVLPSYSENFGMAVAEALSHKMPVITTRATPWEELESYRCGWWIEVGVAPLVTALREAMALNDLERREMGARGRQLIEDHYTWAPLARKLCAVYDWMRGAASSRNLFVEIKTWTSLDINLIRLD
jgi:glycosyltransferase involved in cell wall biosynthesis